MNRIIEEYYRENGVDETLSKKRIKCFEENPDIKKEFEHWIESGEYVEDSPITIEGYSAESLSKKSIYLNGEGAFLLLIDLRSDPQKTLRKIDKGFKVK